MASVEYIAATVPAKVDHVSGTTLFHVAMIEDGDPLQWAAIASLNGLIDPWVIALTDIAIPPVFPTGTQNGLPIGTVIGTPVQTPVATVQPTVTVTNNNAANNLLLQEDGKAFLSLENGTDFLQI